MKSSKNKRILFLALSGIGNLIMQLPAITAVKKQHPAWHITVCVAPRGTAEIARSQPGIDDVLEMPIRANAMQHIKNIITLHRRSFDVGVALSPGQLLKSAAYLFLAGIPVRIGNSYPFNHNPHATLFLTKAFHERPGIHDIEQNLTLITPLCDTIPHNSNYELIIPEQNIQEAKTIFAPISYKVQAISYVGIHAGSALGFAWKRWPLDRFAEVARLYSRKHPSARFIIFGSHNEQTEKMRLADMINNHCSARIADTVTASLMTTAATIQRCSLFISNDSGLMHIAAAVGVPTIGLFGPTDECQTGPRGAKSVAFRAPGTKPAYNTERAHYFGTEPHISMLAITPQQVLDTIGSMAV
ncbi:MAG: hypothetical protein A3E36_00330 [Candidatus Andersenbacteria bacterium RIFCSPHIGHO2_12_FULL_45_11b]|uniref:Lipopolysaccharide heptosyltransferase II n=1 Tax=Candidatus Andersenbacteria bacterium RIFCSPHIGHO2_12_FULL_45_11b TaxID=1797282 RepID=A0A1G1XAQ3_9BACT|nr:MAG: hypothetical protein A3E36_00330 [Candidatus Andersenbacteria bacterium RIFCSPHIGHO2_12_FULL_45_11b]